MGVRVGCEILETKLSVTNEGASSHPTPNQAWRMSFERLYLLSCAWEGRAEGVGI